jgi:Pyruvate/2-oxoacid:ferredoxin oxidoreductase gamma subunit
VARRRASLARGRLVAVTGILPLETVAQALRDHLPESKRNTLEPNLRALQCGAERAQPVPV